MTDNKEREAFERDAYNAWVRERYIHPEHVFRDNYAWDAWQARAALAASQEKAEPVAWGAFYFGGKQDGRLYANCDTKYQVEQYIADVHRSNDSITLRAAPIYTAPIAAQANEPICNLWLDPVTKRYEVDHCTHPSNELIPVFAAPQPSVEAVRNAALEEALAIIEGVMRDQEISPDREAAAAMRALRALKSAPPQPAEQPSASSAVLTDEQSDALIRLEDDLGCPRHNPSKVTVFADDLRTIIAIASAQGEQA